MAGFIDIRFKPTIQVQAIKYVFDCDRKNMSKTAAVILIGCSIVTCNTLWGVMCPIH